MKPCDRWIVFLALVGLILFSSTALAQVDGVSVFAETTCDGYQVDVLVTLNVYDVIPVGIAGWVVEREVLGNCDADVDLGGLRDFPTEIGEHEFVIRDIPTVPGKAIYYIKAVDENGARQFIGWPRRSHFAQADCFMGLAARGTVVIYSGPQYYLEVCPDECWWWLSFFDPIFPPDQALPPEGAVVDIHGEIFSGMEGPYIHATSWEYAAEPCQVVGTEDLTWGSLKAHYR
jgi:hypothetical protein